MRNFILGAAPALLLASLPAFAASSLMPYSLGSSGGTPGELRLFDPANPVGAGNPITVDTGLTEPELMSGRNILTATINGNKVSNLKAVKLIYLKNGRVWAVGLAPSANHTPARVSNITDACQLEHVALDLTNATKTLVQVDREGADHQCNTPDDVKSVVNPGMGPTAKPKTVPGMVKFSGIYDATGAIVGTLVVEQGAVNALVHRTPAFTGAAQVMALANTQVSHIENSDRSIVFRMRPSGQGNDQLFRYDMAGNGTSIAGPFYVFTGDGSIDDGAADADNVYYTDGPFVLRTSLTATDMSTTHVITNMGGLGIGRLLASPGGADVVYDASNQFFNNGSGIYSVARNASNATATQLAAYDLPHNTFVSLFVTAGPQVFINSTNFASGAMLAIRIKEDGTGRTATAKSFYCGFGIPVSFDLTQGSGPADKPTSVFRGTRAGTTDTFKAINPATGRVTHVLGSVDNVLTDGPSAFGLAFGSDGGLSVQIDRGGGNSDSDGYYFDSSTDNSLVPIVANPGTMDEPIGGF